MTEHELEQLSAYLDGELLPDEAAHVEALLAESAEWQTAREQFARADGLLRDCDEEPPPRPESWQRAAHRGRESGPSFRMPLIVTGALLLVIAVLLAVLWSRPTEAPSISHVPNAEPAQDVEPSPPPVQETTTERPAHLDATVTAEASPEMQPNLDAPEDVQPEPLSLALAGTVLGRSPAAVLRDMKTGKQKVYRVGDEVREGVTVVDVSEKEVLLSWNGEEIRLTLGALTMEPPPERTVSGLWRVILAIDGQEENFDDLLTFKQDEQRIDVTDEKGEPFASGTLVDRELMLQFTEGDKVYVLRGTLEWTLDSVVMRFQGATPYGDGVDPNSLELRFTRIPDEEQTVLATLNEREREVRGIRNALMAYARDHQNLFPATLDMLVPGQLPLSEAFSTNEERRVTYDGQHRLAIPDLASAPKFEDFRPYLPLGERWNAYDELLRTQYGGDAWLSPATVLKVEYSDPAVTYTVTARGDLREKLHGTGREANASTPDDAELNAWITQDQNNLQQLRILIQMFENENEGFSPGGWVSIYPEYMTDPSVLTSPKDDPGTDSYLYLYPGTQLRDLVAEQSGDPEIWSNDRQAAETRASEIPILLNRTDFPGPDPGRNVVYLDWHVSYVPRDSDEWRTYVEPHLRRSR